ncbi:MAG TPA: RES family NAD+ phosphorylase [Solirubrobacter sp.]|nr:RES family NAD+ phosphorylase [Solirubrobacter sp.]
MNLRGFPVRILRGDRAIFRIHKAARGPWWFSDDGSGRFDPGGTGHGACYFAERPIGAWIEVFRKRMLLAEEEILARALFTVQLSRDLRLADVTSRRALKFGVTASVGAGETYHAGQRFAADALAASFDGVRYLVRHDPAQKLYGYAIFGPAGAPDPHDPLWPAGSDTTIPDALVDDAQRIFHYRVLPTP